MFGYLTHNGFSDTAAVVARDVLAGTVRVSASDVEEVQRRQQVPRTVSVTDHMCFLCCTRAPLRQLIALSAAVVWTQLIFIVTGPMRSTLPHTARQAQRSSPALLERHTSLSITP